MAEVVRVSIFEKMSCVSDYPHQPPAQQPGRGRRPSVIVRGQLLLAALLSRCSGINELVQLDTVWTVDTELLEVLNFDIDTVIMTQYL